LYSFLFATAFITSFVQNSFTDINAIPSPESAFMGIFCRDDGPAFIFELHFILMAFLLQV